MRKQTLFKDDGSAMNTEKKGRIYHTSGEKKKPRKIKHVVKGQKIKLSGRSVTQGHHKWQINKVMYL